MENKPQMGLGEFLRGERERRHITIEQVASATKINVKLLHALESDNYDALPAKPFVRGFVTSYTRYVGLDYREVLARFDPYLDEKSGRKFKRPADAPHIFVEKEGQSDNSKTALTVFMAGFLVLAIIVFAVVKPSLKHHRSKSKDKPVITNEEIVTVVPPPSEGSPITVKQDPSEPVKTEPAKIEPAQLAATPAPTLVPSPIPSPAQPKAQAAVKPVPAAKATPVAKAAPAAKPMAAPKPAPAPSPVPLVGAGGIKLPPIPNNEVKHRLIVRALDDAWVKYQVDDRPLQQYTLKKDKVIFVRARTSLRFTTAKPKALEISFDNQQFHPYGSGAKPMILPKEAADQYSVRPFVDPNPAYLSTPRH